MNNRKPARILFPSLQGQFLGLVLACGGVCAVLATVLTARSMSILARELPSDGDVVMERIPGLLLGNLGIALAVALPMIGLVAWTASMRSFGVLYRFSKFLEATAEGRQVDECRLRANDPLQTTCTRLNRATEAQRARNGADSTAKKAA